MGKRSKRSKVVSLTKTSSKGKSAKTKLIESIRESVDQYNSIFVFTYENMRANLFKDVRIHFRESRIYMGKNSIAQLALGKESADEYKTNLNQISTHMEGNVGIMFTDRTKEEVVEYFNSFHAPEFAKAGHLPTESITIPTGNLFMDVSMLNHLRLQGMIVEIEMGQVMLREPFKAAVAGVPLTPEQCRVLKFIDTKLVDFTIKLICHWEDEEFEML